MNNSWQLNGSDYLMLGFDHELRRRGYAGNSCQIVLELDRAISPETLRARLGLMLRHYAIVRARPGGLLHPKWSIASTLNPVPTVRVHTDEPGLDRRIFNEPLAVSRGELLRLDLVNDGAGGTRLLFTWTHALLDAPGAEYFLALLGDPDRPLPDLQPPNFPGPGMSLRSRCKLAWKTLHLLDEYCRAAPRSPGLRHAAVAPFLHQHTERLSPEETRQVRANGARLCGVLGDAQYHAAVSVKELHRLHERLGCPSPSYVVPVPVGLRRKGGMEPLFGNQLGMLMFQFLPAHLDSIETAVTSLKRQAEHAVRARLLESGVALAELFRFLPRSLYVAMMKHGLRGEICSFFFGDTGTVNPQLKTFLGARITDFTHIAAVIPSPGISVIYYHFGDLLRVTVVHSTQVLNDAEAAEFAAGLRARLLNP